MIYVVIKIARQFDGEYVFVQTEKAFSNKETAENFAKNKGLQWEENFTIPNNLSIKCLCERGIHEVEVE